MRRNNTSLLWHTSVGFTVVELLVATGIIAVLMALLFPAVQQVRESSRNAACTNNLRQLALACHQFEGTYRVFPPGHMGPRINWDGDEQRLQDYTWTGHLGFLFPYLEQTALYSSLDPDLWKRDLPTGPAWFLRPDIVRQLATNRLSVLHCPSDFEVADAGSLQGIQDISVVVSEAKIGNGNTNYLGCSGIPYPDSDSLSRATGIFYSRSEVRTGDITDGLSTTLLMGEVLGDAAEKLPDIVTHRHAILCGAIPVENFWRLEGDYDRGPSYALIFRSRHNSFVNMAFADGSVRRISSDVDSGILKALGSIAGGEVAENGF